MASFLAAMTNHRRIQYESNFLRMAWVLRFVNASMKSVLGAVLYLLFSGCAAATQVQQGRMALLYGDPGPAITSFQRAAESDPNYIYFSVFPQGVWTNLGRGYYIAGRLQEAHEALERAVALDKEDSMGRLYLGLTSAQIGDRQSSLKEIESGLRGLHEWLDDVNHYAGYSLMDSTGTPQMKSARRLKTALP